LQAANPRTPEVSPIPLRTRGALAIPSKSIHLTGKRSCGCNFGKQSMGLRKGSKNILIRRVHDVDQIYQQWFKGATVEIKRI
jgi:hypothetical protein